MAGRTAVRVVAWFSIVLAATACRGKPPASEPDGLPAIQNAEEVRGHWSLVAGRFEGKPLRVVPEHRATLEFGSDGARGRSPCGNFYNVSTEIRDGTVSFGEFFSTGRGCPSDELLVLEESYTDGLYSATTITGDGQTLLLSRPDAELRFTRLEELDTEQLIDRVWTLEGLIEDGVVTPPKLEPATLELHNDGTFTAGTGCRTFTGRYVVVGDEIQTPESESDVEDECPDNGWQQDGQVIGTLGDGFTVAIEGDTLTITGRAGAGLLYRAS